MRIMLFMLMLLAVLASAENGRIGSYSTIPANGGQGGDAITITPISNYQITFTTDILGLCYLNGTPWNDLIGMGEDDDILYEFDALTGTLLASLPLHANNTNGYGVCYDYSVTTFYTNDWSDPLIYNWNSGSGWASFTNPAGSDGRGMDFDGTFFWQSVSDVSTSLFRLLAWQPGGSDYWYDVSSHIPSQMSGITCFWESGSLYVCVTTYDGNIYVFYIFGTTCDYIGSATLPASSDSSFGLAYCNDLDRFFWSYSSGGNWYIYMFEMDLGLALNSATWGEIKASF
ncbi:MAG: hypothetical protein K8S24_04245 [Candidatus Aegiribacteria sp.]|nr:hypothetical protein [Candidatus Aegiribacteria sp.]